MPIGTISDIQRYSLHDGPGIRTVVFLKGCPLHCKWCCNPESLLPRRQLSFMPERCIGCNACAEVCPSGAVTQMGGRIEFDRSKCLDCGACSMVCYPQARVMIGREMTVDEVLQVVERDRKYYDNSGGGITLSGGEMSMQWRFSAALLENAHAKAIHTCVETSLYAPWTHLEAIFENTDVILFDLKHMDSEKHKKYTGVGTELIHENVERLVKRGAQAIARIPLIPGFNDDVKNLTATAEFIRRLGGICEVHGLPYHRLGVSKYALMGYTYALKTLGTPADSDVNRALEVFIHFGLRARANG